MDDEKQNVSPENNEKPGDELEKPEDSVLKDINTAKGMLRQLSQKLSTKINPIKKSVKESGGGLSRAASFVDERFIKKAIKAFVVGVLLIALIYIGFTIFSTLEGNGQEVVVDVTTPTPGDYRPYGPSVYADDPVVLQLEEDLEVLGREISSKNFRESSLTPPRLDWDVNFK